MTDINYNLTQTVEGPIDDRYRLDAFATSSSMPFGMFMSKFEETDVPSEGVYDDYARNLLTDHTSDTNLFAHEEPWKSVNMNSGILNLHHNGHRGTVYSPYRPEHFDGFGGPEDIDPRGINVDPDMRRYVEQSQSRGRFQNFTSDASDQVTGGGVSQAQIMAQKQKVFKGTKGRLKIFDRQLDGRRNGLRKVYGYKSEFSKQQGEVVGYGDVITDYALVPQNRANFICAKVLRDTKEYRSDTADGDFTDHSLYQSGRRAQTNTTYNNVADAFGGMEANMGKSDATQCYKSVGILMSNIVRGKKQSMSSGDIDMETARSTMIAKTAPMVRDISIITQSIAQDSDFHTSDQGITSKTPMPQQREHMARVAEYDQHSTPSHHYLNAEIIFKSVKQGRDLSKVKNNLVTTTEIIALSETQKAAAKGAKMRLITGRKLATDEDADVTTSVQTVNYKHVKRCNGDKRSRMTSEDGQSGTSDNSQVRQHAKCNTRIEQTTDTVSMMDFGANISKDRRLGGLGSKYTRANMDRDNKFGEMEQLSM